MTKSPTKVFLEDISNLKPYLRELLDILKMDPEMSLNATKDLLKTIEEIEEGLLKERKENNPDLYEVNIEKAEYAKLKRSYWYACGPEKDRLREDLKDAWNTLKKLMESTGDQA